VDGILVILLRIKIRVENIGVAAVATRRTLRDRLCTRIEQFFDANLNHRRHASLQLLGSPPIPGIQRCLLHFVPCFLTRVGPGADNYPAGFEAASPPHLFVTVSNAFLADNFTDVAPPGPKTLDLRSAPGLNAMGMGAKNAEVQSWANRIAGRCLQTMGLVNDPNPATAGSYMSPPSYRRIVQTVMDAGASPPVVR
jgi:hypothetical protein